MKREEINAAKKFYAKTLHISHEITEKKGTPTDSSQDHLSKNTIAYQRTTKYAVRFAIASRAKRIGLLVNATPS